MRPDVEIFLESNPTIEVLQLFRCGPLSQDLYESDEALWVEDGQSVMGVMSDGTDREFLPSLKLVQTPESGRLEFYGSTIEWLFDSRPELRFEEEEGTQDGARISPDLAALIRECPDPEDGFYHH